MAVLTASFDATGLVLGDATARHPDLQARFATHPGADGPIVLHLHMRGPDGVLAAAVEGVRARYDAAIEQEVRAPGLFEARVTYRDIRPALQHPLYGMLLPMRALADEAVFHFEHGTCTMKVRVRDAIPAAEVVAPLRAALAKAGLAAMVRMAEDDPLPDWEGPLLSSRTQGSDA